MRKYVILFLVISFTLLVFCKKTKETNFEILKNYIENTNKLSLKNYNKIYILTESGCHTCNKEFSLLLTQKLKDSKSLFVINASGNQVDISEFDDSKKNILYFKNGDKKTKKLFESSKLIYFNNSKIDTIIKINAQNIEEQFAYIEKRK